MKSLLYKIITAVGVVGIAVFATVCGNGFAHAEDNATNQPAVWMQISPLYNRVSLTPGQVVEDKFTVENTGSGTFKYKVYAAPYSVTNENYDASFSNENNYTKLASWVTFRTPEGEWVKDPTFEIKQGEKHTIEYRITVPQDVPAGGQYATLFAESVGEMAESSTGIKTSSRVGLILYGAVAGDTRRESQILDFDFSRFLLGGAIKATSKVKNTGNIDFNANYDFEVKTLFGQTLYQDKDAAIVLPETERRITNEWKDTPWIGVFQVHYSVSALGEVRDETAVVFVMPIFAIILMILFLTVLIIWTIIAVRKSRERKNRR